MEKCQSRIENYDKGFGWHWESDYEYLIETVLYKNQMDVRAEGVQIL